MALTYRLHGDSGVIRSDGASIPADVLNRDWRKYLKWVEEGNTPAPEFTEEEVTHKEIQEEVAALKGDLLQQNVWLFRMIMEMWKAARSQGVVDNSMIDPDVLAKAQQWVAKLDRLKEIDE